ncbi:hypothetical protein IAT38_008452 [Cryptococcus sp. DSM 104549]
METTPNNPLRYDQHTALQQPPYTSDDWVALLKAHLDAIGDAARFPLEEVYFDKPSRVAIARNMQRDRVVKGLGWELRWGVNKRVLLSEDSRLLLTNIRSPIPQLEEPITALHSAEYQRLISSIYSQFGHPVTCALAVPECGLSEVLSYRNNRLASHGWSVTILPQSLDEGYYAAPWSRWDEQAEERYAMKVDPARHAEWESARQLAEPVKLEGAAEWLFEARASGVCRHSEPKSWCWCRGTDEDDNIPDGEDDESVPSEVDDSMTDEENEEGMMGENDKMDEEEDEAVTDEEDE